MPSDLLMIHSGECFRKIKTSMDYDSLSVSLSLPSHPTIHPPTSIHPSAYTSKLQQTIQTGHLQLLTTFEMLIFVPGLRDK